MPKPQLYTKSKTFKFSKQQIKAFEQLEKYNVNVSHFVREAIKEKIQRDWKSIKERNKVSDCPF